MHKDGRNKPFASARIRQQASLDKLKKYLYLKDTYGIIIKDIKNYSLVPSGKIKNGKPIYFSNLTMKDGSSIKVEENIEELLGLC
jgi:hypothetical protein